MNLSKSTDDLIASTYAAHAKRQLAYCLREWHEYTGTHYQTIDDEIVEDDVRQWLPSVSVPPKAAQVNNIVRQVRSIVRVAADVMPCWLMDNPPIPAADTVAVRNGLLDLRTRQLHPHNPDWLATVCLPYSYDPEARCPTWEGFLRQSLVDPDQIALAQEWAGYCLTATNPWEKLLWCYGPTRAGKGVYQGTLAGLVGDANSVGTDVAFLASSFGLMNVVNRLVVTIGECQVKERAVLNSLCDTLKRLTGGDKTSVNIKGKAPLQAKIGAKICIASNELPRISDESGAMVGHILMLEFPHSNLGKEDVLLKDRLQTERAGILNWAVDGLARLRERGRFVQPVRGKTALAAMAASGDPFTEFVEDYLDVSAAAQISRQDAYVLYQKWCDETGQQAANVNGFGVKLHHHVPGLASTRPQIEGERVRSYKGVGANDDARRILKQHAAARRHAA